MSELFVSIKGVLIRDIVGSTLFSRMYDNSIDTKKFEDRLFSKSRLPRIKDDLFQLDQTLIVHKFINELHFYVIGSANESPIILDSVLECLVDVVISLLNKNNAKQSFHEKRAQILAALEEICHNMMLMECDSDIVLEHLSSKDDTSEQTMTQRLQSATEQFKFAWIRS